MNPIDIPTADNGVLVAVNGIGVSNAHEGGAVVSEEHGDQEENVETPHPGVHLGCKNELLIQATIDVDLTFANIDYP